MRTKDTLSHNVVCAQSESDREKLSCDVYLSTRADTFGANSSAATPGTSAPGFEVLNSQNGPNSCSFDGLTGGPRLFSRVLGSFKVLPAD